MEYIDRETIDVTHWVGRGGAAGRVVNLGNQKLIFLDEDGRTAKPPIWNFFSKTAKSLTASPGAGTPATKRQS